MPITITNNGASSGSFEVQVTGVESWANPVESRTVTLAAGQSTAIVFYLQLKEEMPEKISLTANLVSNSNMVDSKSIEKNLAEEGISGAGITGAFAGILGSGNLGNVFWIVADVVLIILAVWLIKALFTRKK